MQREQFKSRLGFLLIAAGCAVGIGNVWRFPYITGQYGGALFVLMYLFFLIALGIPLLTVELAIGRASRASIAKCYENLEKKGSFWHVNKWWQLLGNYILMSFYGIITGWMLYYFLKFALGQVPENLSPEIADKNYDLSPNKYVEYHKEEVKPYAEVLAEFKRAYENMIAAEAKFREIISRV